MSDPSKRLPLAELEQTREYQRLTQKQKLFVATYCTGGLDTGTYDAIAATQTAYVCKNADVARIMSYALMENIRIIAALNRHFAAEPIEEFLQLVDRAIHNKNVTQAQVWALKLKCDILGLANKLPTRMMTPEIAEKKKRNRKTKASVDAKPESVPVEEKTPFVFGKL